MVVISLKRCCSGLWSDRMVNRTTYRLMKLRDTKDNSHFLSLIANISFPPLLKKTRCRHICFYDEREQLPHCTEKRRRPVSNQLMNHNALTHDQRSEVLSLSERLPSVLSPNTIEHFCKSL